MPRAKILFNALPPPLEVDVGTTVPISNDGIGGENTFNYVLLDRPEFSVATITGASNPTATIGVDVEGTYLIGLTVNAGTATVQIDVQILYVSRMVDGRRYPAAGETVQANLVRGWAEGVNRLLGDVSSLRSDSGTRCGVINASGLTARQSVVYIPSTTSIKSGLPGEEPLPTFAHALATSRAEVSETLFVLEKGVVNGASPVSGEVVWARRDGVVYGVGLGGLAYLDPIYVSNAGELSATPGTYPRAIGYVVAARAGDCDVQVEGGRVSTASPTIVRFGSQEAVAGGTNSTWPVAFGYQLQPPPVRLQYVMTKPGRWSNLAVRLLPTSAATGYVFRVSAWKNGVEQSLSVQFTVPGVVPPSMDLRDDDPAHAVTWIAGDEVAIIVTNVTAVTAGNDIDGIAGSVAESA